MRKLLACVPATVTVVLLALVAGTCADEVKIPLDKVPKAVLDAVKAKFPDADLTGAEKDDQNGKVQYEVALKHKGQKLEVILTPDGKIIAVEKAIGVKDLPKAVTSALDTKYPKATLKSAEEVTKDEKVTYEVQLVTAQSRHLEVVLNPQGKILKEEEQNEKKEEKKEKKKS